MSKETVHSPPHPTGGDTLRSVLHSSRSLQRPAEKFNSLHWLGTGGSHQQRPAQRPSETCAGLVSPREARIPASL